MTILHRDTYLSRPAKLALRVMMAGAAVIVLAGASVAPSTVLDVTTLLKGYARPVAIPAPDDNPSTPDKIRLGKMLFFDPRLSRSGAISCASCHNPALGWQDGLALGVGDKGGILGRHTPTILDLAWGGPMFWDGRADGLEAQAVGPMMSDKEMGGSEAAVIKLITAVPGYRDGLKQAFPDSGASVTSVAKAISAYERTLVSGVAPFDRWIGGDSTAISTEAKRGFVVFNTKGNCAACHSSWRFTDDGFHDIGVPGNDPGRGKFMPGITVLDHAFKTPTLRNVAERAPYMHDGSMPTLEAVIDHYDHGFVRRPSLSDDVRPLHLTDQDKSDLVAFLRTLTSTDDAVSVPNLPK